MNWIDGLIILVILIFVYSGWRKGFLAGSLELLSWASSVCIAFVGYPYLSDVLAKNFPGLGLWSTPLSFILIIVLTRILLAVIIYHILKITPKHVHHNPLNHAAGMIPGLLNGLIAATILSALLLAFPLSQNVVDKARDSKIANNFAMQVEWLSARLSPVFDKAVNKGINKLTVEPSSHEIVSLPFKTTHFKERPDLEARMLVLVNEERRKYGLDTLKPDTALKKVALAHSADMFERGYFAHETPEGKDPFDRMYAAHIKYHIAGENLALAQTLSIAHQGLMNSPGHRANILKPEFGRAGIGILDGGFYGLMISQEFRN